MNISTVYTLYRQIFKESTGDGGVIRLTGVVIPLYSNVSNLGGDVVEAEMKMVITGVSKGGGVLL